MLTQSDNIITQNKEIVISHYEMILSKAKEHNLDECSGKKFDELKNEISYLRNKYNQKGQIDYAWDDLLFCADDLRYAIASVLFYQQLGLSPIVRGYSPSNIDWLFCFYLDDSYSRLYSTWNRVGNFLNIFFGKISDEKHIYFSDVIDNISEDCGTNNYYLKFKEFRDGDCQKLINPYRNEIIHNQTSYYGIIKYLVEHPNDPELLKNQQQDRDGRPQFLVEQYQFLYNSFEDIINLVKTQFPNEVNKGDE